jgi:maleamate amidohydrolase
VGFGTRPVLLVIDAQNYMVGERGRGKEDWPYSCGEAGWQALDQMKRLCMAARGASVPVIFTQLLRDPNADSDRGVFGSKVALPRSEHAFFKGTKGSEIVSELGPEPGDLVIQKGRMSAFFGTLLLTHLQERNVDTVITTGGSTSNCVRATVVDAASYGFRTIVPAETVFDRFPLSHHVSLFDMDRAYADVVSADEVLTYFEGLRRSLAEAHNKERVE